jgi:hypothetical protein
MTKNEPEVQLTKSTNKKLHTIQHKKIDEAIRMLGVFLSPNGDFSAHLHVLKTRADKFAFQLRSSRLLPHSVRTYHKTMYSPSMRYSLPAIATDEEELNEIQTKIVPIMIQKIGASSKTPTVVRHGPLDFGGMDIFDLRTEAGIEAIKYLRNAVYSNTETGKLILINLHRSQQEAGIVKLLLQHPNQHISYLTPTWVTSIRQYLSTHNITMDFTEDLHIPLRRINDNYIMDPTNISRYSAPDQLDINLVRIFLGVATLADITEGPGKRINNLMYQGTKDCSRRIVVVVHSSTTGNTRMKMLYSTTRLKVSQQRQQEYPRPPIR